MTKSMKLSDFEAQCAAVIDEVARTGDSVTLTKDGLAVAEIVPHKVDERPSLFGFMKGEIEILGDIISPIDVEWNAMK